MSMQGGSIHAVMHLVEYSMAEKWSTSGVKSQLERWHADCSMLVGFMSGSVSGR